ncbi:MAG: hypothetical protein ACI805_000928, partial [Candidatus Azotimanducaceae bacterium]
SGMQNTPARLIQPLDLVLAAPTPIAVRALCLALKNKFPIYPLGTRPVVPHRALKAFLVPVLINRGRSKCRPRFAATSLMRAFGAAIPGPGSTARNSVLASGVIPCVRNGRVASTATLIRHLR